MVHPIILEICVESVADAVAAERGGADRIELCVDLACGGVTPGAALMRAARNELRIPIHVLVRPRAGNFCYSEHEIETMHRDIDITGDIGVNGIVLGVLDSERKIDHERTRDLVNRAHPLPVTFHRAFDECPDLTAALETVVDSGAVRVLTSGGKPQAIDGIATLEQLVTTARDRVVVMPGGGIRQGNVARILQRSRATEVHTSLSASITKSDQGGAAEFERKVRDFKRALETIARD
jgi:copper homeostasis protein